ncbi:MAG: RNA polymerase sigma factor [Vicinamibacteria bacterium]
MEPRDGTSDKDDFRQRALACLDGLYAFALSLARDRSVAEDLVQETFLRALRAANRPGPDENLRAWLFTILHNVWRNERRRKAPRSLDAEPALQASLPCIAPSVEQSLDAEGRSLRLRRAIDELGEPYREVVMLRFGEGLSYHAIAQALDCPAGTVMSRLARARAHLHRALGGPRRLRRQA